jgi:transcriptional regulator with XRE-family HTH domain
MPLRSDRLKQRRQFLGYTQEDLARRLGVSQQQVGRWESGTQDTTADFLGRLAKALNCTADWLLGLVEQPQAHLRARELSAVESQLLELYRQRKLPDMIMRLVNELSRTQTQEALEVDGLNQPKVAGEDVTPDG